MHIARRHPLHLARQAALAEEMADLEEGDHRLFACMRQDGEPDGTRLDIHDARRRIALGEDRSCGFVLEALQSHARPIDDIDGFERRWGLRFAHRAALHCTGRSQCPPEHSLSPNVTCEVQKGHERPSVRQGLKGPSGEVLRSACRVARLPVE
jgi:hypothetical protein